MNLQNQPADPEVKYTICFILRGDKVLMLYRSRVPNKHKWNGVGGKIEAGETPLASMQREIHEEVGIHIESDDLHFSGIVTWDIPEQPKNGMYVFIANTTNTIFEEDATTTPEGILSWKTLTWVLDKTNPDVVTNISRFLPHALKTTNPQKYAFTYEELTSIPSLTVKSLRKTITRSSEKNLLPLSRGIAPAL